ncbi:hypothetical protein DEJ49_24000 [Streptomyces venezuelae]|uniref:Uncharacterized protein n=1 Tax=Streptomyces venezuelae TaxID=54571 RepID=A0A5P2CWQ7_STRVZ|nr:hypothetical protein DEJ49_24000 [Streptomyces venezuelae]
MTTGGMGREPGMLIRMRVVSVVWVSGSPGRSSAACRRAPSLPPSSAAPCAGEPYGGVPEG